MIPAWLIPGAATAFCGIATVLWARDTYYAIRPEAKPRRRHPSPCLCPDCAGTIYPALPDASIYTSREDWLRRWVEELTRALAASEGMLTEEQCERDEEE